MTARDRAGPRPAVETELAPLSAYRGGDATMKASVSNQQQFAAAPAATIATAVRAERPRAGEPAIRLGRLLPEAAREAESMYAFLYFTRDGEGNGTVYYAPPGALVHADARLCRARNARDSVLALAKVCGGSGEAAAPPAPGGAYPETILLGDDGHGFERAGLCLDSVIGTGINEADTVEERAAAAERRAKAIGGEVYTQVDADNGGIAYERGLHLVNRTGLYAVAKSVRIGGGGGGALAWIMSETGLAVDRARPDRAGRLVEKAAGLVAESEHDARVGGAIGKEVIDMLLSARYSLVQAAEAYHGLAQRAEAAAEVVVMAYRGAEAAVSGGCPARAYVKGRDGSDAEYVDEWFDLSSEERDEMCEAGEDAGMYTDEYKSRLEMHRAQEQEHDATCRHRSCAAASTPSGSAAPSGGAEPAEACRCGDDGGGRDGL